MQEKQLFGSLTMYRGRGAYLRRLEQYEKAEAAYNEAIRNAPEDVSLLTGRSQVYAQLKPEQAYNDAELALQLAPKDMTAKHMKARAQYAMTDFEKSLISNYRAYKIRKQPPVFREGAGQCLETIQDCIGENAGNVMLDFLPLIKQEEVSFTDDHEPIKSLHVSRIPKPKIYKKLTQIEIRRNKNISRVLAMKYLGPMANDKFFLQELIKDQRLKSANLQGGIELQQNVCEALNILISHQDRLRAQRPYYTIKLSEKTESKHLTKHKQDVLLTERITNDRIANNYMRDIAKFLHSNQIKDLIAKAERMQAFLDTKTAKTLVDKESYIDRLYKVIGEGYLSQYRLSYALTDRGNRQRVAFLMGMKKSRPSSFDSVIAAYPQKFDDQKCAIRKVEKALHVCENLTMQCFLNYELSRLFCQQKNFSRAKYYAVRCQQDAIELNNNAVWWMNGCLAMMSVEMQQGNVNEMCAEVDEALLWSRKLPQGERVEAFLMKCKEIILQPVVIDDRQVVMNREKEILNIMDDKSRIETEVLFKQISRVTSRRQFSVLPGMKKFSRETDRRKYRQPHLTIIPGPERPLRRLPASKVAGFQTFDIW